MCGQCDDAARKDDERAMRDAESYLHGMALAEAKLANWMTANGFATGHGDSLDDMLIQLRWQVDELREKRLEETLRRSDGGIR